MVIAEAMACGVPAVPFACPCGPKDIIRDGEDGRIFQDGKILGSLFVTQNDSIFLRLTQEGTAQ